MLRLRLDGDPAQIGELGDPGLTAKTAIARSLHAAERHLCLVMDRRPVDVTNAAFDALGDGERTRDVPAEHGGREAVFRVVGKTDRIIHAARTNDRDDGSKTLFGVDAHARCNTVEFLRRARCRTACRWTRR